MLDQMDKRPGTMIAAIILLDLGMCIGLFVGALLFIKWLFF